MLRPAIAVPFPVLVSAGRNIGAGGFTLQVRILLLAKIDHVAAAMRSILASCSVFLFQSDFFMTRRVFWLLFFVADFYLSLVVPDLVTDCFLIYLCFFLISLVINSSLFQFIGYLSWCWVAATLLWLPLVQFITHYYYFSSTN